MYKLMKAWIEEIDLKFEVRVFNKGKKLPMF